MSEHINEWLGAYLDGELSGNLLQRVENHLADCQVCLEEYRSLQQLSNVLQEAPLPEPISSARFASQVSLRLPLKSTKPIRNKALDAGWWLVPIGLTTLWIFIRIAFTFGDWLSIVSNLGFISPAGWIVSSSPGAAQFTSILREFGLLGGSNLEWAAWSESITRTIFSQITWQVSIAILYLSWMVIWWARQRRKGIGQPFETGSRPTLE